MLAETLVAPGDKVLDAIGEYRMGKGLYEANRRIFASVAGFVNVYGFRDVIFAQIASVEPENFRFFCRNPTTWCK